MDSTLNAIIRIINIYDTVVTWLCSSDWANTCFDLLFPLLSFTTKKITLDLGGYFYTFTEKRAQKRHESLWQAIEVIIFKGNNDHQVRYEIAVTILHYKWVLTRPFFADNVQEADRRMCRSHSTMIKHKKLLIGLVKSLWSNLKKKGTSILITRWRCAILHLSHIRNFAEGLRFL